MDSCDNYSSSSVERQSDSKRIETGGIQKKLESHRSSELAGTSTGRRDAMPGKCMLQKGVYDFGLGNLYSASSGHDIFEVSLDLQLKPPCKPEPRFNWSDCGPAKEDSDEERISLGLSLLGSCIDPELHDTMILKNEDIELDPRNLSSDLHVNSEPCRADVSLKTAGPSNLLSDCRSCGNEVKNFYDNFETSCGSKVNYRYSNFEIDLNIPLYDSDDTCQATASSSKPTLAELAWECVAQDQDEAHHDELPESSSLSKEMDVIVANSAHSIPEHTELEPKELNTATNVSGSDGSVSVVSQGNKPGNPDVLSGDQPKMVTLNCNGSSSSKVSSDEVPMELDGKNSIADSGEEIEEFEEVLDEVFSEDTEEYEEILEEVSGEEGEEEFEEEVEVSCDDDQSDGSHHAEGDENACVEEFEEAVEEVACDDESDSSHHGNTAENIEPESDTLCGEYEGRELARQRQESALYGIEGVNSVAMNMPTAKPSQHVGNARDCMEERNVVDTMLENLQPSANPSCGTWGTKSGLSKDIAEATEVGNMKKGWESGGAIAEASEEGSTKQGWGTWETKSGPKDTAEVTRRGRKEASRHQNAQRFHPATTVDARKNDVPLVKGGRIITFKKTGSERSFEEGKRNHGRATPTHIERERFPAKSFRHEKPHPSGHRDDRRNRRIHRPNQFGMRRSEYTWVREENDYSHCDQKFHKNKTAVVADAEVSSQRQAREGETQLSGLMNQTVRNVGHSPSGGYLRRDAAYFQAPAANERRVVRRDFPGGSADHPPQYVQVEEGYRKRRRDSPVIQNSSTGPRGLGSSTRPFKHRSRPRLGSPQTSARAGTQFSHERARCPPNPIAPRHEVTADDAREITPQYNIVPATGLRRDIGLRMFHVHPRQVQVESFSRSQYYHESDRSSDAGSYDERHTGVDNGPPAYPQIRRRLGCASNNKQTVDAEFFDEVNFGVENDHRPVQYGREQHDDFHERSNTRERRGNVRVRSGGDPNEGRCVRGQAGNYSFSGRKVWLESEVSDAGPNRRR